MYSGQFQDAYTINFAYRNELKRLPLLHSHHKYEIYYYYEGCCHFLLGERMYALKPGDLLLLDGMTLHTVVPTCDRPYIRTVIHFHPDFVGSLVNSAMLRDIMLPFRGPLHEHIQLDRGQRLEFEATLERMHRLSLSDLPLSRERFALTFLELLYYIAAQHRALERPVVDSLSEKMRHVQQIVGFLSEHYAEDLHLEHLQEKFHLSKTYMATLFKEITGTTVFNYLRQQRLNRAKLLFITEQQLSVADVCFRVGYKHPSHFSRLFKRQFGVSPEAYRKNPTDIR